MNKQALIDNAVELFNGKWPAGVTGMVAMCYKPECKRITHYPYYFLASTNYKNCLCTKEEFEQRASELGWINGYKWGVEYQTNGKKPDLDADVMISWKDKFGYGATCRAGLLNYQFGTKDEVVSFTITGRCYKTKQPVTISHCAKVGCGIGQAGVEPDNSWHERGDLPPVGVECEINYSKNAWFSCVYRGETRQGMHIVEWLGGGVDSFGASSKFRPIKSQRDKFVEAIQKPLFNILNDELIAQVANALYDAEFKAPDEKSNS